MRIATQIMSSLYEISIGKGKFHYWIEVENSLWYEYCASGKRFGDPDGKPSISDANRVRKQYNRNKNCYESLFSTEDLILSAQGRLIVDGVPPKKSLGIYHAKYKKLVKERYRQREEEKRKRLKENISNDAVKKELVEFLKTEFSWMGIDDNKP